MAPPNESTLMLSFDALQAEHRALLRARRASDNADSVNEITAFLDAGKAVGAYLYTHEDRDAAQSILDYWVATLYSLGEVPDYVNLDEFDESQAPHLRNEACPYIGLDAFRQSQNGNFYGRHRLIHRLVSQLQSGRLLAIIGPSGSGKSSVVMAGLLPALHSGAVVTPGNATAANSSEWRYPARMVPGSDPIANLISLVQTERGLAANGDSAELDAWRQEQRQRLMNDPHYLMTLANERANTPLLLFIDQFEETFTLCADPEIRTAFIDNLLVFAEDPESCHRLVLTMRSDFEALLPTHPRLQSFVERATVRVLPMSAAELRSVIEEPAHSVGLRYEDGVVEALVEELVGEPAALPLLQFTLLKLWENREFNQITWNTYRKVGSGRVALARAADALYESLIPANQTLMRHMLLRLVRPSQDLEVASNRVRLDTLLQLGDRENVETVLNKLIESRLLKLSDVTYESDIQVELAHEALVRNWPKLVGWIETERESLRVRHQLTDMARRWERLGRSSDALLRGIVLDDALGYDDLSLLEQDFVTGSLYLRASQKLAAEVERLNEVETVRRQAERMSLIARRLRRLLFAQAILLVITILGSIIFAVSELESTIETYGTVLMFTGLYWQLVLYGLAAFFLLSKRSYLYQQLRLDG